MSKERAFEMKTLLSILSRLYDGLLITKEEKLEMEDKQPIEMKAALFDLMSKKESTVAAKIFMKIRTGKDEHEAVKKSTNNQLQNPMQINTVIRNVFEFLKVEDIKICRSVCQKWNFEAEHLLRKNSKIAFGYLESSIITKIRRPENFVESFRHFSESATNLPFTSFIFMENVEWRVSDLKNFIDQQKNNIKELELCGVKIFNEDRNFQEQCDVSDWFADFSVPKLTISCIDGNLNDTTLFELPFNILTFTTHIKLDLCSIRIGNESPIAPRAIHLTDLKIWKDGNLLPEFCLNDLIDFTKATYISINSYEYEGDHKQLTILRLDLSKCMNLNAEYVALNNIEVLNWKDFKAIIKTLQLEFVPFEEKTNLEIKELYFSGHKIDLSVLPLSIEKIHFGTNLYLDTDISCSEPINLPNLKLLKLQQSESFRELSFFATCSKLQDIEIDGTNANIALNLILIPKSVKRMKLEKVDSITSDIKLELENLILEKYSLVNAAKIVDKITPKILILQWEREFETSGSVLSFLQKFKDFVLYIGPFIWDATINVFEMSPLLTHVDRKAEYYIFENNQGRCIQQKEFNDMKMLDKN